jgi:hypothetical protein
MNRTAILADYIDRVAGRRFQWGVNDCLIIVAGAVELLTGVDHADGFRGRYNSLAEGKKLIGTSLLRFVAARLQPIEAVRAVDGDVGAVKQGREWGFGVFIGPYLYVMTENGIGILPRTDAVKAFRVP